jgi:hypothetical protein
MMTMAFGRAITSVCLLKIENARAEKEKVDLM